MQAYEKLGAFYLGKRVEAESGNLTDELLLYDSKDLTTHALCVGMTGSGKTGLCVGLLEEAAIDGVPAIVIDPKGDLGNLLLTFPDFKPSSYEPWIDPSEATRKGLSPSDLAKKTADLWKNGLADWDQDGDRIRRLREAADFNIFTPGSRAGVPLKVLRSFQAPPAALLNDEDAFRERIAGTVSGLLGLLGIDADPIQSREHILISNLLDRAWREGRTLDLAGLIREIQSPPFQRVGVLDLDAIFPPKDRFQLSMRLNNLLASPGFSVWMEGAPLDIPSLLYSPDGRPRISIVSIAHLSDEERMFVVTLLLNELNAWMRTQPGTSSLRALLYMDEIFGYFPPSKNPPSKTPMLTLLKQARAFGVGVVLSTQNPVDLDYKGLSNCGTWFLGRLQTERDKLRILDGLEGASAANGQTFDRSTMDTLLAGLGKRVFLMNNVHEGAPILFHTRWVLSYLRGPMTRQQITEVMEPKRDALLPRPAGGAATPSATQLAAAVAPNSVGSGGSVGTVGSGAPAPPTAAAQSSAPRPIVPDGIDESFIPWFGGSGDDIVYRPHLLGRVKLHHVKSSLNLDEWSDQFLLAALDEKNIDDPWPKAERVALDIELESEPAERTRFVPLPVEAERSRSYKSWAKELKNRVYQTEALTLFRSKALKEVSKPGESEGEFRGRLAHAAHEQRDLEIEKLRQKYEKKLTSVQDKIQKAELRVDKEEDQLKQQKFQTVVSVGATVLGALFGRKLTSRGNIGRAATAARGAGRVSREQGDIERAQEKLEDLHEKLTALEAEFEADAEALREKFDAETIELETVAVPPRKSDIDVDVVLVWTPWQTKAGSKPEPAFLLDTV